MVHHRMPLASERISGDLDIVDRQVANALDPDSIG
jgi:hypothetical protein